MQHLGQKLINLIESNVPVRHIVESETGKAIVRAGGIESLLVCFAEVIRSRHHESSDRTHSRAFGVLLQMSQSNQYYQTKFLDELNGLKLAEFILSHPLCKISEFMLDEYMDFCLAKDYKQQQVTEADACRQNMPTIKSSKLIYHLMTSWRAWHKDVGAARNMYENLINLLQAGHMNERDRSEHNHRLITDAGGIEILMDILRECIVPADEVSNMNHELIELIVNLITLLIRHPPTLDIMRNVMGLLVFLHPDHKAYVEPYIDQIAYLEQQFRVVHCSNRSFAIANIADMLASIVKLSSNDPMGILSEALQCCVIEPRKLIILANNNSHLVREKVLRLFLYCIRACYALDLRPLLNKYEQQGQLADADLKQAGFRLNLPIQLMARQLLRYPTTIKMVQLCYGIIVGVDDFEAVDRVCLNFDIDPLNNQLQLNTLILLIQLSTQLQTYKEIVLALQFIHAYLRQLIDLGQEAIVLNLIKRTLLDSLMKLYFLYVEHKAQHSKMLDDRSMRFGASTSSTEVSSRSSSSSRVVGEGSEEEEEEGEEENEQSPRKSEQIEEGAEEEDDGPRLGHIHELDDDEDSLEDGYDEVLWELDRFLILITCSYLQNLSGHEANRSLSELVLYFSALNSHIPHRFQEIMRDRIVKILATALHHCRHYEQIARDRVYEGKLDYYLKSFFKNTQLKSFNNSIPDSQFVGIFLGNLYYENRPSTSSSTDDDYGDENESSIYDGYHGTAQNLLISSNDKVNKTTSRKSSNFSASGSSDFATSYFSRNSYQQPTVFGRASQQQQRGRRSRLMSSSDGQYSEQGEKRNQTRELSEAEVLERFQTTFSLILDFIVTREPGVIPSSLERDFVMRTMRTLYKNLLELSAKNAKGASDPAGTEPAFGRTHWSMMLAKLERLFRATFSQLILFLLSPCDSMNLDERRYFAHKLFSVIEVERLTELLEHDSAKSTQTLLLTFIKDLLNYATRDGPQAAASGATARSQSGDETASEECVEDDDDDELFDYIEIKLRLLIVILEFELKRSPSENGKQAEGNSTDVTDQKFRAVWLADLNQAREGARERSRALMEDKRANSSSILGDTKRSSAAAALVDGFAAGTGEQESDRLVDEAVSITREVVNDKHELRKIYLGHVKQKKVFNYHIRQQWLSLIIGHTHERAIWHMPDYFPNSWELNPVEGPSRTRRRLRPCKLGLADRFLRRDVATGGQSQLESTGGDAHAESELAQSWRQAEPHLAGPFGELFADDAADWHNQYSPHPLCSMVLNSNHSMDSNELRIRMFTTDKIHFNCDCNIIRPNEVCQGEVSIASWCIHFIGERSDSYQQHLAEEQQLAAAEANAQRMAYVAQTSAAHEITLDSTLTTPPAPLSSFKRIVAGSRRAFVATLVEDLWFDEIVEIWDRRYQLQDVGLEIFLTNNMTYLLSFRNNRDREDFKHHLFREQHKMINLQRFNSTSCLNKLTRLWRDGKLTNFDYLTCLNKLAGRSFNDLMQYPIFPFVLADYTSNVLDLNNGDSFRRLDRPMAVQLPGREEVFKKNYAFSQANLSGEGGPLGLTRPYHYGNHYSNSATVLHFLVRLPPFTQMLIQYQDNNFDQPDRTFHSMANSWQLITRDSNTDFKELIPEFFFLPEMFTNIERLELGTKQNGELVDDVRLPPWCPHGDARLFTLIHRQALESAHVSEHLHHWIDLIFGYKQTGKPAVDALNVFHPATYYGGIDLSANPAASATSSLSGGRADTISSALGLAGSTPAGSIKSSSSLGLINPIIASVMSARSSKYDSDYISDTDGVQQAGGCGGEAEMSQATSDTSPPQAIVRQQLRRFNNHQKQADIERTALETMIKTYGQMPRQLFMQPMRQRSVSTFTTQQNQVQLERLSRAARIRKIEPLRQVRGLRWGSYVGSPDEGEIVAVARRRLPSDEAPASDPSDHRQRRKLLRNAAASSSAMAASQLERFHLCLLANGDVVVLRKNSCLMLDYRTDRKSSVYQLSLPALVSTGGGGPSPTSRGETQQRAGLSNIARMNLFASMIISRQQFSFLEPIYSPASQLDSLNSGPPSPLASLTGSLKSRFTQDSLRLVSWHQKPSGVISIKHPAMSSQSRSLPLIQADSEVDKMTTCCSIPELNLLLVGYKSGSICAHIVSTTHELWRNSCEQASTAANALDYAAPSAIHFLPSSGVTRPSGPLAHLAPSKTGSPVQAQAQLGEEALHASHSQTIINGSSSGSTTTTSSLSTLHGTQPSLRQQQTGFAVSPVNKTSRWLYCHTKKVNCIKINVSFGIVVTGSDDGSSVIWDLNSLTYVRTIDYKVNSLVLRNQSSLNRTPRCMSFFDEDYLSWNYGRANTSRLFDYLCRCSAHSVVSLPSSCVSTPLRHSVSSADQDNYQTIGATRSSSGSPHNVDSTRCCICCSGISLIAISDTLGDIVSVKNFSDRLAMAATGDTTEEPDSSGSGSSISGGGANSRASASPAPSSSSLMTHESELDANLTSVIYVHTINGALIGYINCHTLVTAVCYSNAPEGVSVNVIVVGMSDGLIRLYSSWDLSRVKEFRISDMDSPVSSILYTRDSQLLYIVYDDDRMVVLRNKKKGSLCKPKEWVICDKLPSSNSSA